MKTALEFAMKHEDMIGAGGPQPAFVKANPAHPRRLLREVFYTHPRDFVATPDPARGFCHSWGVHDVPESDGAEPDYNGLALVGNLYLTGRRPEHQFVAYLAERKSAALAAARPALEAAGAFRRDVTLLVELQLTRWRDVQPAPPTWRRLRLSGGLTLAALHDKVLAPSLGWTRNFHAHLFTDRADGAQFGAPDGQSVDQMHMYNNGWMVLDGAGTRVAELLRAPGDTLGYLYDLGDGWAHVIRLEEVLAEADSSGAVALLGGAGSCTPENSGGLSGLGGKPWQELLTTAQAAAAGDTAAARKVDKARAGAAAELNYSGPEHAAALAAYPLGFDLQAAQERLRAALASRASVAAGSKQFIMPMGPNAHMAGRIGPAPPGQQVHTPVGGGDDIFMSETLRTARDDAATALCDACGSPAHLRVCAGCRKVRYCGPACQKKAWKAGHKQLCQGQ